MPRSGLAHGIHGTSAYLRHPLNRVALVEDPIRSLEERELQANYGEPCSRRESGVIQFRTSNVVDDPVPASLGVREELSPVGSLHSSATRLFPVSFLFQKVQMFTSWPNMSERGECWTARLRRKSER